MSSSKSTRILIAGSSTKPVPPKAPSRPKKASRIHSGVGSGISITTLACCSRSNTKKCQEVVAAVAESPRESHTRSHTKSVDTRNAERAERRSPNAVAAVKCSYFLLLLHHHNNISDHFSHSAIKINT